MLEADELARSDDAEILESQHHARHGHQVVDRKIYKRRYEEDDEEAFLP